MTLADGREVTTALYDAHLILDDEAYSITVAEARTTPLVGTGLLWGFSLFIEFQAGGAVDVESLSSPSS